MIYLDKNDVLLFQGDSITHGGRKFSTWDQNHLIGHGYQDYVAQTLGLDNIDRNPTIVNTAVSGDNIKTIIDRMQKDIIDIKPTVMSILDGTNDATVCVEFNDKSHSVEEYDKDYRFMLDKALKEFPDLKLIICEPFRYIVKDAPEDDKDRELIADVKKRALVCRKIAEDYNAIFVPFWSALDEYVAKVPVKQLVWDGIHPTYVGHGILAKCWLGTVEKNWNK